MAEKSRRRDELEKEKYGLEPTGISLSPRIFSHSQSHSTIFYALSRVLWRASFEAVVFLSITPADEPKIRRCGASLSGTRGFNFGMPVLGLRALQRLVACSLLQSTPQRTNTDERDHT